MRNDRNLFDSFSRFLGYDIAVRGEKFLNVCDGLFQEQGMVFSC